MDFLSLAVGFLTGAFTSAAGNYLADKYTDVRRGKEEEKKSKKFWRETKRRFPSIIEEMECDLKREGLIGVRVLFVKESNTTMGFVAEPYFEYYTDKHPELTAAVHYLQDHGLLKDITPGNTPMYRMSEPLIDLLLDRKH